MRAVAEDYQVAQKSGVSVRRVFSMTWMIAAVVAGIGGVILASLQSAGPQLAILGLVILPVVFLGGLDSIPGAILAGVIIGVLENLAGVYLDPLLPHSGGLRTAFPFIIMLIILMFLPYGFFGLKRIERV